MEAMEPLRIAARIEAPIAYEHDVGWHATHRGDEVLGRWGGNHPDGAGSGEIIQNYPWSGNQIPIATPSTQHLPNRDLRPTLSSITLMANTPLSESASLRLLR
jgi:hypothetical protein